LEEDKKKKTKKIRRIIGTIILLILLPFLINQYSRIIAHHYAYKGHFLKAIEIIKYTVKFDKKLFGNKSKAAVEAQEELANYYFYWGDVRTALDYYLDAYNSREEKGYINDYLYSNAASNIAICYVDLHAFKKAEFYNKEAIMISKKQNDRDEMIAEMINLANLYIKTNQIDKAKEQISQLDFILKEKNIQKNSLYPSIIYAKAKYYEKVNNLEMAKKLIEEVLSDMKSLSKENRTRFLSELAKIYQLQGDYDESEKILPELIILGNNGLDCEKAKVLREIAALNIWIKHNKQAKEYLTKSLDLLSKPAYNYSYNVVCDYNYLLMLEPQNQEYLKYFKNYTYYINGITYISIKDIKTQLNSVCNY